MQPYEIIMSPGELWIALEGEAFPVVDAVPGGNWARLGKYGVKSQSEKGIDVSHEQTIVEHGTAGYTGPVKAIRTKERLTIAITVDDLSLETYSKALNNAGIREIAQAAGVAGAKVLTLHQGSSITTFSVMLRFASPEGDGLNAQYQIPKAYNAAVAKPKFAADGTAASLDFSWVTLEDPNAASDEERFGTIVVQTLLPA